MSDSIIVNVNPTSTDLVVINSNEEIINQVINVDEGSLSTNISINTEPNENVIISTDDVNVNENVNINQGGFVFSVNGKIGHIILTKDDFGLGNVDNTSDLWKPISYPTLSALALKADWSYVSQITSAQDVFYKKVADQVRNSAPVNSLVVQNSGQWNEAYDNLVATSAFYLGLSGASKQSWDSVYATTFTNSSFWTQAYSNLSANSAFYVEGGKGELKFLSLSGGTLRGNLIISTNPLTSFKDNSVLNVNGPISFGKSTSAFGENSFVAGSSAIAYGNNSWIIKLSPDKEILNGTISNQFLVSAAGGIFLQGKVGIGIENFLDDKLLIDGSVRTTDIFYDKNGNSNLWNSVYSYINQVSANEEDQQEIVSFILSNSSNIINVNTKVNSSSANWDSVYNSWNSNSSLDLNVRTFVNSTSSNVLQVNTVVNQTSANWNSVYSYINQVSSTEEDQQEVVSFVLSNSSNILEVNSKVNLTSANWDSVYSNSNLNSGHDLEVRTFVNSNSSNIVNVNTKVNNTSANWDSVYSAWNNVSSLDLNVRTYVNSNSSNINNVLTRVNTTSANWNSVYSAWNNVSSLDLNVRSIVNQTSGNWNSVYSSWNNTSGLELNVRTYVNSNSSNVNNVLTRVNTTSANWNSVYSSWNSNSSLDLNARTYVNSNSSNINNVLTRVNSTSANWNSVYSSWNNTSGLELNVRSVVNQNSANWNSVYSYVNNYSAQEEDQQEVVSFILTNSSNIINVNTQVNNTSANWNSVYSSWNLNSADLIDVENFVKSSSANNSVFNTVCALSTNWNSVYSAWNNVSSLDLNVRTYVNSNSARFQNLLSTVSSTSSTFATILFSDSKYVPLSSIDRQLNANSTNTVTNSAVTNRILQIENSLNILVPAPTYTAPAATLTNFSTTVFEVGQNVTASLVLGYTQNDGGAANFYRLEKNSTLVQEQATAFTRSVNETAVLGLTRYTCIVTHLSGAVKNNAIGLPDSRGVITAGTKSINREYNSYYRQFHGSVNTLPTSPSLVRNLTGLTFTTTNSYTFYVYTRNIAFAIPSSRQLVSIITGSFENLTTNFNLSTTQVPDAAGTPRDYKLYTYTTVNPYNSNFTITLS